MQKSGATNIHNPAALLLTEKVIDLSSPRIPIKAYFLNICTHVGLGLPVPSFSPKSAEVDHITEVRAAYYYGLPKNTNECCSATAACRTNNVSYGGSSSDSDSLLLLTKRVGIPSIRRASQRVHENILESRDFNIRIPSSNSYSVNKIPLSSSNRSPFKLVFLEINIKLSETNSVSLHCPINNNKHTNSNSVLVGGRTKEHRDDCSFTETKFHSFKECKEGIRKFIKRNLLINTLLFLKNLTKGIVYCDCEGGGKGDTDEISIITPYVSSTTSDRINQKQKDSRKQSTTPASSSSSPSSSLSEKSEDTTVAVEGKMKEEKQLEFILKSLVAGGVAGMCAKTAVAPLDRMKILLQAHSKHYSHLGVFSGLRGIVQKESLIALYKGNGAQMVRIFPYAATQFTSFELYKKFFGEKSHIARFGAGSCAGVTAVALTYPLDTIRARLAFQVTGEHVYSGIYNCAVHIFREEGGVRALYRGFIPTVCGMIPYAGLSFYCFESFKYMCMKYLPAYTCKRHSTNTGGLVLLVYAKLICGGVAGAVAQTVSYPMDVTRRRMQLAMMDEKTKKFGMGMLSTIRLIYQENGVVRGLYRGMSINYLRAIPMVAVSFSTYELVKQMLSLDTGLPIKTG